MYERHVTAATVTDFSASVVELIVFAPPVHEALVESTNGKKTSFRMATVPLSSFAVSSAVHISGIFALPPLGCWPGYLSRTETVAKMPRLRQFARKFC